MKFVVLPLLVVCVLHAVQTTGQQTFECPGLDVPDGCGAYVNCNNGQVEKDCSDSTPDCDQGADFCLQHCVSCSGAGDNEDELAVLSANDCLPAEGRGDSPTNDVRIPAWKIPDGGSWGDRTASYTGIGRMTRTDGMLQRRCAHCTGFAIEDDFILTAAHCVVSNSANKVKKIALGRVGDKIKTYVADVDENNCKHNSNYHSTADTEFDYAVCKIAKSDDEDVRKAVQKFNIDTTVEAEKSFTEVNIAGYPILNYPADYARQGRYKLPFQLDAARPCKVNVLPASQDRKILKGSSAACLTTTGQSGSPMFQNGTDTLRLYGIVSSNNRNHIPTGPALTKHVKADITKWMQELNSSK